MRHKRHGFYPWVGKIPWNRKLQTHSNISCLENSIDRGAWRATVHGVAKSRTWLSVHMWWWWPYSLISFTTWSTYPVEKEMATHSSIPAWRILWTEEPGGLLSVGSHRVGHDWSDHACMHALEKEMATHCSVLDWRIPGTEEPGGLPSIRSHRVGHDWSSSSSHLP